MTTLISGTFQTPEQARHALSDLRDAGFADADTASFAVDAARAPTAAATDYAGEAGQGQPAAEDPAVSGAVSGAVIGSVVGTTVGLVTLPLLGPASPLAAAGIGAYVGSLYGALGQLGEGSADAAPTMPEAARTGSGADAGAIQVEVEVPDAVEQDTAIRILRAHGATGVDRTQGRLQSGHCAGLPRG
jgi:uncharacterized protein YcfJ